MNILKIITIFLTSMFSIIMLILIVLTPSLFSQDLDEDRTLIYYYQNQAEEAMQAILKDLLDACPTSMKENFSDVQLKVKPSFEPLYIRATTENNVKTIEVSAGFFRTLSLLSNWSLDKFSQRT